MKQSFDVILSHRASTILLKLFAAMYFIHEFEVLVAEINLHYGNYNFYLINTIVPAVMQVYLSSDYHQLELYCSFMYNVLYVLV